MSKVKKKLAKRVRNKAVPGTAILGPVSLTPDSVFNLSGPWGSNRSTNIYSSQAWVYAAVRSISQNISGVPRRIQVGPSKSPTEITEETNPGPALELFNVLENPNQDMTSYQLFEATCTYLNLQGRAHWVLERSNLTEVPKAIYVAGKHCMEPVLVDGNLIGWIYTDQNTLERVPLTLAQTLTYTFFNPDDPLEGLSPLEAAMRGIKFDILASIYGSRFFENNAVPGGVLSTEKRMSRDQAKEQIALWEQRHQGAGNVSRVAMLHSGTKYQATSMSQKEMEFTEQRKWTRDEILAVFKVPKSELSLYEDLTNANALSQDKSYWLKTLIPIALNIQAVIKSKLIPGLIPTIGKGLKIFFDFDVVQALQDTISEKIKNGKDLYMMGVPVNTINQVLKLGLPNIPWGDTVFLNSSLATVEDIISGEARAKTSGPPMNNEQPGADANEDEDQEEPLEEAYGSRIRKLLQINKSIRPVHTPLDFKGVESKLAETVRTYLWRLRRHQMALCIQNRVFQKDLWDQKLDERVKEYLNPVTEQLRVKFALTATPACGKVDFNLNSLIYDQVMDIYNDMQVNGDKLDRVREVFVKLSDRENVTKISKLIILSWVTSILGNNRRAIHGV